MTNKQRKSVLSSVVPSVRPCLVSVRGLDGATHTVEVTAATLFEAAAAAVASFKTEKWAADALTPSATLRVEVRIPPIVHEVPLRSLERWLKASSPSPREEVLKRAAGKR